MNDYNIHPLAILHYLFWGTCSHQICFPKLVNRLLITICFLQWILYKYKEKWRLRFKELTFSKKPSMELKKQGGKQITRGDNRCSYLVPTDLGELPPLLGTGTRPLLLLEKNTDNCLQQNKGNLLTSKERYLWIRKALVLEAQCLYTHTLFFFEEKRIPKI